MRRWSASLIIRERQIKTTMRYDLIPYRMAVIKKDTSNKYWQGYGKKENSCALMMEIQIGVATVENRTN